MSKLKLVIASLLFACLLFTGCKEQRHTFEIGKETFKLDGEDFVIRSGEMHYDRIPKEYWRHRIQMAKAMGLNTICTYIFWNKVEPQPDQFDQQSLNDMKEFFQLLQEEGMWGILRPGPYVCAEWDMGGLPWWLLKKEDIVLRSQDPYFLERSKIYLKKVGEVLAPLQVTNGGNILMVQVENEFGHYKVNGRYGGDIEYLGKIKDYIIEAGFNVPLFQCDYYTRFVDRRDDLFCMVNFGSKQNPKVAFDSLRSVMPEGPMMVAEYYPGWLDHWGDKHGIVPAEGIVNGLNYFLEHKASFNFYMLHGGTSFGLWSGANHPETEDGAYQPQTSSYDYDAPISEAGWDTPKYMELRNAIEKYLPDGESLIAVPARPETMEIKEFELTEASSVLDNLPSPVKDVYPRNMEMYDQGYGYIVYSKVLKKGGADSLLIDQIRDYAVVMIDNKPVAKLDRRKKEYGCILPARNSEVKLDIIVEAMGRINSEMYLADRKGIVGKVYLKSGKEKLELTDWNVFPVNLYHEKAPENIKFSVANLAGNPGYYKGYFEASEQKDTFLNVSQWGKGLVWVNGHCLGRFWNIGPTQTMYLPGPWIKKGKNEVIVLDFISPRKNIMHGRTTPILDECPFE